MSRTLDVLTAWALALWVGGSLVIGYLVTPTLFAELGDRRLAGEVAGILFQRLGWLGLLCGGLIVTILVLRRARPGALPAIARSPFCWTVVAMMACTAANLFYIQPTIAELKAAGWPDPRLAAAHGDLFARWHGVSAVVFLAQSLLGLVALGLWSVRSPGGATGPGRR